MRNIWQEIINLIDGADVDVVINKGDAAIGDKICRDLNIPSESVLYSVVSNSNGIVVNHWIRILGQDSSENNGVYYYNSKYTGKISKMFLVANDIVGGLFAISIDKFEDKNFIWYFAPDTLEWECLNMQYNEFIAWCFKGNVDEFYASMRWKNWKEDVKDVGMNNAILIYPFLWAKECDIESATKKEVAIDEIIEMNFEYSRRV